jgi:hypothetical protein
VPGTIVGWSPTTHTLVEMTPNGQLRNAAALATRISRPPVMGSFQLLTTSGQVYTVEAGALIARPMYASEPDLAEQSFGPSPFANFGNALVEGGRSAHGAPPTPFIVNLLSGNSHKMPGAPATAVAGDPRGLGAWATVVGGTPAGRVQRVEYRRPGKPPVNLVTANRLAQLARFTSSHGLKLTVYPSPSGRQIAIEVQQPGTPPAAAQEIVVLSRTGHLLGKSSATGLTQLVWSDTGRELLLLHSARTLSTWILGHNVGNTLTLPTSPGGWRDCILAPTAPTAPYAICVSASSEQQPRQWALIRLSDGAVANRPANEIPVDWSR